MFGGCAVLMLAAAGMVQRLHHLVEVESSLAQHMQRLVPATRPKAQELRAPPATSPQRRLANASGSPSRSN